MKAIIINGYTTDLADELGIFSYPGRPVVHLVLPEEGLRITPYNGQLLMSSDIGHLLEQYERSKVEWWVPTYRGEEIEIGQRFVSDIRRLLRLKSQLEGRLAGETSRLAKHFAEPLNRHIPREAVVEATAS